MGSDNLLALLMGLAEASGRALGEGPIGGWAHLPSPPLVLLETKFRNFLRFWLSRTGKVPAPGRGFGMSVRHPLGTTAFAGGAQLSSSQGDVDG